MALAFVALAWIRAQDRLEAEERRIGERAQDNAATVTRALDAQIEQVQALLQSVAYLVDVDAEPLRNDTLLRKIFRSTATPYANVFAADTLGRNVGAALVASEGRESMNLSIRPYFAEVRRTGRFTAGAPVRSRALADKPWIVPFIAPIPGSGSARPRGYVGATIMLDSLEAVRIARRLPAGSVLTVLDEFGTVIIRTLDTDRWLGRKYPTFSEQGQRDQPTGNDTIIISAIDSTHRLFGSERSETTPWRVYVGLPVDTIYAPARKQFVQDLVIGLFAGRGYNIESLTVAETDRNAHTSRVTIVTRGTPHVLGQIEAQLEKMVSTRHVQGVTRDPNGLERELALVKVRNTGAERVEALRVADIFRARVIDTTHESFVFEITGAPNKIDKFAELMRPLGLVELSRTGVLSITRGTDAL